MNIDSHVVISVGLDYLLIIVFVFLCDITSDFTFVKEKENLMYWLAYGCS